MLSISGGCCSVNIISLCRKCKAVWVQPSSSRHHNLSWGRAPCLCPTTWCPPTATAPPQLSPRASSPITSVPSDRSQCQPAAPGPPTVRSQAPPAWTARGTRRPPPRPCPRAAGTSSGTTSPHHSTPPPASARPTRWRLPPHCSTDRWTMCSGGELTGGPRLPGGASRWSRTPGRATPPGTTGALPTLWPLSTWSTVPPTSPEQVCRIMQADSGTYIMCQGLASRTEVWCRPRRAASVFISRSCSPSSASRRRSWYWRAPGISTSSSRWDQTSSMVDYKGSFSY